MPTNSIIPTASTGGVIAAGTQNDMAVLNTTVGLFGIGSVVSGSPPSANAPNWYIQSGGALTVALNGSSVGQITYPSAFPNGLVACIITPHDVAADLFTQVGLLTQTTSYTQFIGLTSTGGSLASSNQVVSWVAVGW